MDTYYKKVFMNQYGNFELKKKPAYTEVLDEVKRLYSDASRDNKILSAPKSADPEEERWYNNLLDYRLIKINKHFGDTCDKTFLDVGCGAGRALYFFSTKGFQVTGIDMVDAVDEQYRNGKFEFYLGDVNRIISNFIHKGTKFDVIHCDSVLEMINKPEESIDLFNKILNPNGVLICRIANSFSPLHKYLYETGSLTDTFWVYEDAGVINYFNRKGLQKLFESNGFKCIDCYSDSYIDFSLFNENTNYYTHPEVGKSCHKARVRLENLFHDISVEKTLEMSKIMADMELGRFMVFFFIKSEE